MSLPPQGLCQLAGVTAPPSRILSVAIEHATLSRKPTRLAAATQAACAPTFYVARATLNAINSVLDAIERPIASIKKATSDDLNTWSLETFFDRVVQFIWSMTMLLTWAPFWLALPSLVRARNLALIYLLGRVVRRGGRRAL